jgi:molecular chaperone HscB
MNYYQALELEPKLVLDPAALQKRFYDLSRQWHPDKFTRGSAEEQEKALDRTALLNDAFRTLRDPISRAEYYLEQQGLGPSKNPPPELLEEVFELNMALEELRGGDLGVHPQLAEAQKRFLRMRGDIDDSLLELFAAYEATREARVLAEIRSALDRRRYVSNLVRDVEKELNVHLPN